ncbi:MAG: thioredoxin domain-containing protein [Clostridia bacterium]
MSTLVNDANYKEEVATSSVPVLVDFFADWCAPCKTMAPIVEKLCKDLGATAKVVKINVDESPKLASKFGVSNIPYFCSVSDGRAIKHEEGITTYEKLKGLLDFKASRV